LNDKGDEAVNRLKRHLSVANVLSCIALFVALGGAAYAVSPLAKKSVKTKHLANGAVTTMKLRNGAVSTAKLRNLSVTAPKLGTAAVISEKIANGAVRSVALGGGVVTTGKIKDGAVSSEKLANGGVTGAKLGANAVTAGKIQDGAVTGTKLASALLSQLVKNASYVTKATEPADSVDPKTITAECPAGKQVIGGGAKITGTVTTVAVTESAPTPLNAESKRTGWTAAAREIAPEAGEWALEAYAICAEF
jgi:trimeric autotransporter adhesin